MSDETAAGTTPGAGDAETELVPPPTTEAPELAWSLAGEIAEIQRRSWPSVWGRAAIFVAIGVVIACVIGVTGWAMLRANRPATSATAAGAPASSGVMAALPPSTATVARPVLEGAYEIVRDVAHATYQGNAPAPKRAGILLSWWAFRSSCTPAACTASGVKLDDINHSIPSAIHIDDKLRYADGQWSELPVLLPGEVPGWCNGVASQWELRPQPDGTLVGTETLTITADCPAKGNVTITPITATRIGPVPAGLLDSH